MKSVLFIFNHPPFYKVKFFNELNKKMKVTALFERKQNKDRLTSFYESENISFEKVFIKGINLGKENHFSFGIVRHLKKHQYDLIVIQGWHTFSEMIALRYLKKHQIPYIFYINGGIIKEKETRLKYKIKRYFIGGASYYFSPDLNSNKYLIHYGADEKVIFNYPYATISKNNVLANPLSVVDRALLRKKLKIDAKRMFVSVGQFIERKNLSLLIKYWTNRLEDEVLVLIGHGPLKKTYINLIEKFNITNVMILDFMPSTKLFSYLQAADAFLFPTKEDIYGHVVNEAMSQGLPVIASKHANSALHLISNNINGLIINFDDFEEINFAIEKVLNNEHMREAAILTAKENTLEKMVDVHLKYLLKVSKEK
ncbi:MAG: glycosyltransferase family 4 protein [Erysipelotrichia bacterium]|nr:glycosyltransferase family 4 protein [Erysipelotrichia bacterium]